MKKVAVLDLGTNTFHLLIVEIDAHKNIHELYRLRNYVNLAEDGIDTIGKAAIQRVEETINAFALILKKHKIDHFTIIGTAALRTASNGPHVTTFIETCLENPVQVITGSEEAHLIFMGNQLITDLSDSTNLIMDIGGGSTEFIYTDNEEVRWSQSFPFGITVLYNKIKPNDPMSEMDVHRINTFLQSALQPAIAQMKNVQVQSLIGSSGSFEVLQLQKEKEILRDRCSEISLSDFRDIYQRILSSTLEERYAMPDIPNQRAKMIPLALILIQFVLHHISIQKIIISPYALKEGVISQYLD